MGKTDPARIARWVVSKLEEFAPFTDIMNLLAEIEALGDEIEEQSLGGITREDVVEWTLEYYLDELLGMLYEPPTEWEELERALSEYVSSALIERLRMEWERRRQWL